MTGFAGYPLGISANVAEEQWEDNTAEKECGSIMAGTPTPRLCHEARSHSFSTA